MRRALSVFLLMAVATTGFAAPRKAAPPAKPIAPPPPVNGDVPAATPGKAPTGPRRLEDVHIEGEIPVPQVLFITARDQRRFLDFQHRRYLRNSRQLGEQTILPHRIDLTGTPALELRKESQR